MAVLIIFPVILQTVINLIMLSISASIFIIRQQQHRLIFPVVINWHNQSYCKKKNCCQFALGNSHPQSINDW